MSDGKITLKVGTPRGVFEGTFDISDKVSEVIAVIIKAQGLVEGDALMSWLSMASLSRLTTPLAALVSKTVRSSTWLPPDRECNSGHSGRPGNRAGDSSG